MTTSGYTVMPRCAATRCAVPRCAVPRCAVFCCAVESPHMTIVLRERECVDVTRTFATRTPNGVHACSGTLYLRNRT